MIILGNPYTSDFHWGFVEKFVCDVLKTNTKQTFPRNIFVLNENQIRVFGVDKQQIKLFELTVEELSVRSIAELSLHTLVLEFESKEKETLFRLKYL